ncbi:MAG: hypothetical protein HY744_16365, partial [Deltaproteobacteria bacterium]|nr:hypothetical protein [Deltaproteobacteria bacterium]
LATAPPRSWEADPPRPGNLRVATFNIRNYPAEAGADAGAGGAAAATPANCLDETDEDMLLAVLGELDFDLLAVQEIRDPGRFEALLQRLGEEQGRGYASAWATNAASGNEQHVGLVAREGRLRLSDVREHPEVDVPGTLRAGLSAEVASLAPGGVGFGVLVLHLASGDSTKRAALRAQQAEIAAGIVAGLVAERGDEDFLVLGDLNTARAPEELAALDAAFATGTALGRQENQTGCTAYYVKNKLGELRASAIDHVYAASLQERDAAVPLVSGAHCYERSCQSFQSDGPQTGTTYWGVSDHCPVYFEIRDADLDG